METKFSTLLLPHTPIKWFIIPNRKFIFDSFFFVKNVLRMGDIMFELKNSIKNFVIQYYNLYITFSEHMYGLYKTYITCFIKKI